MAGIALGIVPLVLIVYLALSIMSAKHWMPMSIRTHFFRSALNYDFGFLLNMDDFEVTEIWSKYLCFGGAQGLIVVKYEGDEIVSREAMQSKITTICEFHDWALAEAPTEYLEFFQEQVLEQVSEHVSAESLGSSPEDLVCEKRWDDWDKRHRWNKYELLVHIADDSRTLVFYCDRGR